MAEANLNEKLVFYIQQELDRGEDVVKLKESLIKAGWEEDIVTTHLDSVLDQTSVPAESDPPSQPVSSPEIQATPVEESSSDEVQSSEGENQPVDPLVTAEAAVSTNEPASTFSGPGKPAIAAAIVLTVMLIGGIVYLIFF